MTITNKWMGVAALVAVMAPSIGHGQQAPAQAEAKNAEVKQPVKKQKLTEAQKEELNKKLAAKTAEMSELKDEAVKVSLKMGELASSGKLPTNEEAIKLMQDLVKQMAEISEQLKKLHDDVDGIKGWIEGQNEALPIMTNDILDLKRNKDGTYVQFQYRDTDQKGGATDGFNLRRVRIGSTQTVDTKTAIKWSVDLATGTNQQNAQLKDAFLIYDIEPSIEKVGVQLTAGQQPLPLGYELERSSSEREFPERSMYNQRMFAGERNRGINFKYGLSDSDFFHVGVWDALTVNDPEQSALAPAPESRLGMSAGLRHYGTNFDYGISAYRAQRPEFVTGTGAAAVTHGRVDRQFVYIDGNYVGFLVPDMYIRGELMFGKDRVPVSGTPAAAVGGTNMTGYQVQLGYNLNKNNQFHVR
ncbi:MAG TPA: porin, partial [Fimbriimonas sp.]|nr:porin [Fimbriimonas sp.]